MNVCDGVTVSVSRSLSLFLNLVTLCTCMCMYVYSAGHNMVIIWVSVWKLCTTLTLRFNMVI